MGYYLQAIIAPTEALAAVQLNGSKAVGLAPGLSILPITTRLRDQLGIEDYPLDGGADLSAPLLNICSTVSQKSRAIYVEAAMHGGPPIHQAFVSFVDGKKVGAPTIASGIGPLSDGLRFLGVKKGSAHDEFEAVDLGRHRETDEWIASDA